MDIIYKDGRHRMRNGNSAAAYKIPYKCMCVWCRCRCTLLYWNTPKKKIILQAHKPETKKNSTKSRIAFSVWSSSTWSSFCSQCVLYASLSSFLLFISSISLRLFFLILSKQSWTFIVIYISANEEKNTFYITKTTQCTVYYTPRYAGATVFWTKQKKWQ